MTSTKKNGFLTDNAFQQNEWLKPKAMPATKRKAMPATKRNGFH